MLNVKSVDLYIHVQGNLNDSNMAQRDVHSVRFVWTCKKALVAEHIPSRLLLSVPQMSHL